MRSRNLHSWDLTPREAMALQKELRPKIVLANHLQNPRFIAAADISYSKQSRRSYSGVAVFTYPDLQLVEERTAWDDTKFPYVPGLLTFREGPVALEAFRKVRHVVDVVLFDGQGVAHPRGFGLASHLGLIINKPSIGCAKSRLYGRCSEPGKRRGSRSPILDEDGGVIGVVLRTRDRVSPVYVSQGYKVSLDRAVEVVLSCCKRYRIPQPIRHVHQLVNKLRKEMEVEAENNLLR